MKKLFLAAIIAMFLFPASIEAQGFWGRVRKPKDFAEVCKTGCTFNTIQAAIDAASTLFTAGTCDTSAGTCSAGDIGLACTADADCDVFVPWTIHVGPGAYDEALTIGTATFDDSAHLRLIGAGRDQVIITNATDGGVTIEVSGGKFELAGVTVIDTETGIVDGSAGIEWTTTQRNEAYIHDARFQCLSHAIVPAPGCVHWTTENAANDPKFTFINNEVQYCTVGLQLQGGGYDLLANNRYTNDNCTAGLAVQSWAIWWSPNGATVGVWELHAVGEYIWVDRTTTGAGVDTIGIDTNPALAAHAYFYDATINVTDRGTGTSNDTAGFDHTGVGESTAEDWCINCTIKVNRPNSTGNTHAMKSNNVHASGTYTIGARGGHFRASNSDSSALDVSVSANNAFRLIGTNYVTSTTSQLPDIRTEHFSPDVGNCCAATCIVGEIFLDTTGGTVELCVCHTADTWECLDIVALGTPGPAD